MLKALGDPTRWRIVRELLKGTCTLGVLTNRLDATQYNVSKHVRILREAASSPLARKAGICIARSPAASEKRWPKKSSTSAAAPSDSNNGT